jgi:hypothetical protein
MLFKVTMLLIALVAVLFLMLLSAVVGFLMCREIKNANAPRKTKTEELTEEEKTRIEKAKREYRNFLEYTGDKQE